MNYWRFSIEISPTQAELLLAFLSDLPFEAFEEADGRLDAYLPGSADTAAVVLELDSLRQRFSFSYTIEEINPRNWNAEWEASFQPVRVNNFCAVRADFHPPVSDVKYELVINPRMAFGTGHHETTHLMIEAMRELSFADAKVLDYGCGTGILAILAAKMGALMVDAVDIEAEAYQNTLENAQINNAHNIQVLHGKLDSVLDTGYDIILANINRSVLLDSLPALHQKLRRNGVLLLSGILQSDFSALLSAGEALRFTLDEKSRRGDWLCLKLLK